MLKVMDIKVPQTVEVRDYHEFISIRGILKTLNKTLNVVEVGCNGSYIGIIYAGNKKDEINAPFFKKIKKAIAANGGCL